MEKQGNKSGIILQIAAAVVLGTAAIAILTFFSQYRLETNSKNNESGQFASRVAQEVIRSVKEYQAYDWLLEYWYANYGEMDVEYEADFSHGTKTEEKVRLLAEHQPDFMARYASKEDILALPKEDQKLYAEIAYSWLITRVDEIKQNYNISFLYLVLTDTEGGENPYQYQLFLVSGADEDSVRGSDKHEVYPMGMYVSIEDNAELQEAMRSAVEKSASEEGEGHHDYSGSYADYYTLFYSFDAKAVLVGMSYKLDSMRKDILSGAATSTFYAILYQLILIAVLMMILIPFGVRPLKKILENIRHYTSTKNSAEVNKNIEEILAGKGSGAIRDNEIGQLAEDFIVLTKEIDHYVDDIEMITKENERISAELSLASRIQTSMLPGIFPAFPERKEFDVYASMDPAREVGGDFFDFFFLDEDHLALVMADVSGKGIPGALFMMISKVILHNVATMGGSPSEILRRTNNAICVNNKEEMFVTIWLGILEVSTGIMRTANAGHEYPAIRKDGGSYELYMDKHGMAIGVFEDLEYEEAVIELKPGDKLFVYTDGVPEATKSDYKLFGTERMLSALNSNPNGSPEEMLKTVREAVNAFVKDAEQYDDLTMMCFEYKGVNADTVSE